LIDSRRDWNLRYYLPMKTEAIEAISFIIGGLVASPLWRGSSFSRYSIGTTAEHFTNFSRECIFSDMGATYQVYCPSPKAHS
jgi:hypothetical protein